MHVPRVLLPCYLHSWTFVGGVKALTIVCLWMPGRCLRPRHLVVLVLLGWSMDPGAVVHCFSVSVSRLALVAILWFVDGQMIARDHPGFAHVSFHSMEDVESLGRPILEDMTLVFCALLSDAWYDYDGRDISLSVAEYVPRLKQKAPWNALLYSHRELGVYQTCTTHSHCVRQLMVGIIARIAEFISRQSEWHKGYLPSHVVRDISPDES